MVTILMSALIWVFTIIYGVEASFGVVNPRTVTLNVFFKPVNYESAFLAFLESDYISSSGKNIPMKKILNAVVIQNKTDIWLEGEPINAKSASENLLNEMIDKPYLLKIAKPEIKIAESAAALPPNVQKISTNLFLLNGNYVELEFYVG